MLTYAWGIRLRTDEEIEIEGVLSSDNTNNHLHRL